MRTVSFPAIEVEGVTFARITHGRWLYGGRVYPAGYFRAWAKDRNRDRAFWRRVAAEIEAYERGEHRLDAQEGTE